MKRNQVTKKRHHSPTMLSHRSQPPPSFLQVVLNPTREELQGDERARKQQRQFPGHLGDFPRGALFTESTPPPSVQQTPSLRNTGKAYLDSAPNLETPSETFFKESLEGSGTPTMRDGEGRTDSLGHGENQQEALLNGQEHQQRIFQGTATAVSAVADGQSTAHCSSDQMRCQMAKGNGQVCGKPSPRHTHCCSCRREKSKLQHCKRIKKNGEVCKKPSHGYKYCSSCRNEKSPLQHCKMVKDDGQVCRKSSPGRTYCHSCEKKKRTLQRCKMVKDDGRVGEKMERHVAEARKDARNDALDEARIEMERRVAEARNDALNEARIEMERRMAEERIDMERRLAAEMERRVAAEVERRVAEGR